MVGIDDYRKIVKQLLRDYAQYPSSSGQIDLETIFDESQDCYQLVALGWQGKRRVHRCLIHIDLKGDKVCSLR